jgi:hypothetical protein
VHGPTDPIDELITAVELHGDLFDRQALCQEALDQRSLLVKNGLCL